MSELVFLPEKFWRLLDGSPAILVFPKHCSVHCMRETETSENMASPSFAIDLAPHEELSHALSHK
jgi:hypothetical protein